MGLNFVSFNKPPTPSDAIRFLLILISTINILRIKSKPFKEGDRTQPGIPIINFLFKEAKINRFPGSTGIPKWRILPPRLSIDLGRISFLSDTADAQEINRISISFLINKFIFLYYNY